MDSCEAPRVELFSRAAVSGARTRQREVRDRLAGFQRAGRIVAVDTHSWEGRVRRDDADDDVAAEAVEWYERFDRWASDRDADLSPFFTHNERESELAGESYEEFVFPVLSVAVLREDGAVRAVAPRIDDGEHVTVDDCLDRLADRTEPTRATQPETSSDDGLSTGDASTADDGLGAGTDTEDNGDDRVPAPTPE